MTAIEASDEPGGRAGVTNGVARWTATVPTIALPRPIAYVLGGGASSAAAQVGMLRALAERAIEPDLIVGTSAGALNGAVLADDPEAGLVRLERLWTSMDTRMLIPDTRLRRARNLAGRHHMYRNDGLSRLFEHHIAARTFEQLATRFACVATDLDEGRPAVLEAGTLLDALLATCAIPGVFPAVRRGRRTLVDGLCVANLPVRQALELGAASIVVLDGRPGTPPAGPRRDVRDTVGAAFAATIAHQARADLEHVSAHVPTWVLPGQPTERLKAFEFHRSAELIERARVSADHFLDAALADIETIEAG